MSSNVIPIGLFRFLTPVDTVQVGDYGRCKYLDTSDPDYQDRNWSVVEDGCRWSDEGETVLGKSIASITSVWEFMRPIPGESSHAIDSRSK